MVTVDVEGLRKELLVDSGSEISILKKALPGIPLRPPCLKATSVTGAVVPVQGEQEVACRLEGVVTRHRFVIAPIASRGDGLLGWDLMAKAGVVLNAAKGQVLVQGNGREGINLVNYPGECDVKSGCVKAAQEGPSVNLVVKAVRQVTVEPYVEQIVEGKVPHWREGDLLVEPEDLPQRGLRVARSLDRPVGRKIWIRVVNLTGGRIRIDKGQRLGKVRAWEPLSAPEVLSGKQVGLTNVEESGKAGELRIREACSQRLAHLPLGDQEKVMEVLEQYTQLFEEPDSEGCRLPVFHRIETQGGPIARSPYRVPFHQREIVGDHITQMLSKGVIGPSSSPWSAPVVLVPKKTPDGSLQYRFCTDFRGLNKITKPDAYPLPLIVETLESLGNSQYFTTLDLACGYHQIPIRPEDREKTAFSTIGGHFEYNKLAFGLMNAPATFQRLMDQLLARMIGEECFIYLDDIIIFSATLEEHCIRLRKVLERMRLANLKLRLEKCHFAKQEVKYLGHVVTADGVKPDPERWRL